MAIIWFPKNIEYDSIWDQKYFYIIVGVLMVVGELIALGGTIYMVRKGKINFPNVINIMITLLFKVIGC